MRYLSVASGIEAATVAWHPLGWTPVAFSEIEPFPCAVLAHHYPHTPNLGDMTRYADWPELAVDLLVGGTPCQSFSVAGLRGGLADPRGNLMLTFGAIAARYRPRWLVWENVPGVLSSNGGRDFGTFLGMLGELGYGTAYRVLDAQYFGVPQRRRRVFVVGHLGDWRRAAAVLFERACLSRHHPPSREAGEGTAPTLAARTRGGGGLGTDFNCDGGLIAGACSSKWSKGTGGPAGDECYNLTLAPIAIQERAVCENPDAGPDGAGFRDDGTAYTVEARQTPQAVAFSVNQRREARLRDVHTSLNGEQSGTQIDGVATSTAVRRLTPRECERLQGFGDDYTLIPYRGRPAADGPRYKALGNSMAVPVMAWIGRRIAMVEAIQ